MKKVLTALILMVVAISLLTAADWSENIQRRIVLQGGYGTVLKLSFERIPTQSSSFTIGMPFDIEGRLVRYNQTSQGREIAYWSIIANKAFYFTIEPTKLTSVSYLDEGTKSRTELDYIMTFTYSLGYSTGSDQQGTQTGYFSFNTETETCTYVDSSNTLKTEKIGAHKGFSNVYYFDIVPSAATSDGLIGFVNGSVYFMFTQGATDMIKGKTGVVEGNYTATIKMIVTEK